MRRTAAEAAETRRRVLDAATLAFAERGHEGATFEHIATRIGMTRGAVHHHFRGGKDELLTTLLTEQWARYGETALAPLHDPDRPPSEALRAFLEGYLALLVTDPMFRALVTVTTLVAGHAGVSEQGVDGHRRALDVWRAALHRVLDPPGVLRTGVTPDAAVFVLVSVVVGTNSTAAIEPDRLPRTDDERRSVTGAVLAGLLAG